MQSLRSYILFPFFLGFISLGYGQNDSIPPVFVVEEIQPKFPGGQAGLVQFIADNLQYPAEAVQKGIEGTIYTQFIIDKDGSVIEPKIVRSVHPLLDEEALRLVKLMPKWSPGIQRGRPVQVIFNMPLKFYFTKEETRKIGRDTSGQSSPIGIGVYLSAGYNPLLGSFTNYIQNQGLVEVGTHFFVKRLNIMLGAEFGFGAKTKQAFEANGFWRKGRSASILSPHILLGYEVLEKKACSFVPYGGVSLNGFLPGELEKSDPKEGFQLDNVSFAVGGLVAYRYRYKDRGANRFNTSVLRFRVGYNYMEFNKVLKGSSLAFSVGWGRELNNRKSE